MNNKSKKKYIWLLVIVLPAFFILPEIIYIIPAHEGWISISRTWAFVIALLIGLCAMLRYFWRRVRSIHNRSDVYRLIGEGLFGLLFAAYTVWATQIFWSVPSPQMTVATNYSIHLHKNSNRGNFYRNYFLYIDDCPDPYNHYVSAPKPLHFAINASTAKALDSRDAPQAIAVTHRGSTFFAYHAVDKTDEHGLCPIN